MNEHAPEKNPPAQKKDKHNIVIVGGGAAGIELATRLGRQLGKKQQARITLVDAQNTHFWKPLLHEVASGSLNVFEDELSFLAQAKWNHFHFVPGRMASLNRTEKTIGLGPIMNHAGQEVVPERTLKYDQLVIAVGSTANCFNTPGVAEHCLFLDNRQQAERIHSDLINHYLRAQASDDPAAKLRIAIIGAGSTGVELAAELHYAAIELAHYGLNAIKPEHLEITLIEGGEQILPGMPERLRTDVNQQLGKMGIRVCTGQRVNEIKADGVHTCGGEFIASDLQIWAAGIKAPEFLAGIDGLETNHINQLLVRPTLQTTIDDHIYALGDCSSCTVADHNGKPYTISPTAQAAHQQATMLAKSLTVQLRGAQPLTFHFHNHGSLISLSHFSAVGTIAGKMIVAGALAKFFYLSLHRMHQMVVFGKLRTGALILKDAIGRTTRPQLKLY